MRWYCYCKLDPFTWLQIIVYCHLTLHMRPLCIPRGTDNGSCGRWTQSLLVFEQGTETLCDWLGNLETRMNLFKHVLRHERSVRHSKPASERASERWCPITTHSVSGGSRGGHPGRGPPIGLEKKIVQVKEIISYCCASSARLLICIYLFWGLSTMANGQGNDHSFCYACALENQSFITNFTRHAYHYTIYIQWTHSRTHTCQYDIILYYSTYVVLSNLTSHIDGMT